MAALPIHLRAKRGRQTVFLVADPSDTVRLLKARLAEVNRVAADRIRIYAHDEVRRRPQCARAQRRACVCNARVDVRLYHRVVSRKRCTRTSRQ